MSSPCLGRQDHLLIAQGRVAHPAVEVPGALIAGRHLQAEGGGVGEEVRQRPQKGGAEAMALEGRGDVQLIQPDHQPAGLLGPGLHQQGVAGGLPGVESRGILLWSEGVARGRIDAARMCALLSETPAKLYGAYPRKGVIAPGSDADIVVYDPKADTVITAEGQESRAGYTPFEGFQTCGSIRSVYLRGSLAVDKGVVLAGSHGKYIHRDRPML